MAMTVELQTLIDDAFNSIAADGPPVDVELRLSGGATGLLDRVAAELGVDRGRAMSEAMILLYYGLTVQKEGMHLAVVDEDGEVRSVLDLFPGG